MYNYLMGGYRENRIRHISEVHSERMRSNRHELEYGEFWLNVRKKVIMRAAKHLSRCPGRLWNILKILKTPLDKALSNPL